MKTLMIIATASIGVFLSGASQAQEALAKSAGCLNCHAVDAKKVGPSFKDISAKYKGNAEAEAKVTAALTSGKGHPAVKTSPDDTKALVKWVLSE